MDAFSFDHFTETIATRAYAIENVCHSENITRTRNITATESLLIEINLLLPVTLYTPRLHSPFWLIAACAPRSGRNCNYWYVYVEFKRPRKIIILIK